MINVEEDHPAWAAFTDDDWNGATFSMWVTKLQNESVRLFPPKGCPQSTVDGVKKAVEAYAYDVIVVECIHILMHGLARCGAGMPTDWPKTHVWAAFDQPDQVERATCAECRRQQGLPTPGRTEDA